MDPVRVTLALHALGGMVALAAGAAALVASKGGHFHRQAGSIFTFALLVSLALAVPAIVGRRNVFLGMLAAFTLYLVVRGWRLGRGKEASALDRLLAIIATLGGFGLIAIGTILIVEGRSTGGSAVVALVLGAIATRVATQDLRSMASEVDREERVAHHLASMLAAYIATLTAFASVNVPRDLVPPAVVFLAPSILGVPVILIWRRRFRRGALPAKEAR